MSEFVINFVINEMMTINYLIKQDNSAVSSIKERGGGGFTPYPSLKSDDRSFKVAWLSRFRCHQPSDDKNDDRFNVETMRAQQKKRQITLGFGGASKQFGKKLEAIESEKACHFKPRKASNGYGNRESVKVFS
ncbi:MAG: hypothetical protein ACLQED_06200 [Desulfobaccales bacterium]